MTDTEHPFLGETPEGTEGFILLGQDMDGTVIQLLTMVEGEGFLALDLDLETSSRLHRRLGDMIEKLRASKRRLS